MPRVDEEPLLVVEVELPPLVDEEPKPTNRGTVELVVDEEPLSTVEVELPLFVVDEEPLPTVEVDCFSSSANAA